MTECGLTNLAYCIPEKIAQFLLDILNGALQPMLDFTQGLMTEPVNLSVLQPFWAIIIYVISLFYGLFFLFSGLNLLVSGHDPARRERAKQGLTNVIFMVIFVQASFFIYSLANELASLLALGVMNIIDSNFFLLTVDNVTNVGLELLFGIPYAIVLVITILLLAIRYLLALVGVVFAPIAFFFYFIPPLRSIGKMMINVLLVILFIPFFDAIILFASSALLSIALFENFKIIIMISGFLLVNFLMIFLVLYGALIALDGIGIDVGSISKTLATTLL